MNLQLLSMPGPERNAQIRLLAAQFGESARAVRGRIRHAKIAVAAGRYRAEDYGPDLHLLPLTPAQILGLEPIRDLLRAGYGEKCSAYAKAAVELGINEVTLRRLVRSANTGRGLSKQGKSARVVRRLAARLKEIASE